MPWKLVFSTKNCSKCSENSFSSTKMKETRRNCNFWSENCIFQLKDNENSRKFSKSKAFSAKNRWKIVKVITETTGKLRPWSSWNVSEPNVLTEIDIEGVFILFNEFRSIDGMEHFSPVPHVVPDDDHWLKLIRFSLYGAGPISLDSWEKADF